MPDRRYPVDLLGNDIKKNGLVHVEFPKGGVICRVIHVEPMQITGEQNLNVDGAVFLQLQIPHQGHLPMILCLKEPEKSLIELAHDLPQELVKQ